MLPNITSVSISAYSTYYTVELADGASVSVSDRTETGKREVYTYLGGQRFEMPSYYFSN